MTFRLLVFAAFLIVSHGANSAPRLSAADKAWIGQCANNLVTGEKKTAKSARIYCTCMHEQVENNEAMTQTELERSWPPMHVSCRNDAGWK